MTEPKPGCLDQISIVLHRPIFPENIGACARAMKNMGLSDLRLVEPVDFNKRKAYKMATHVAAPIVDQARVFTTLNDALQNHTCIAATSAREGGVRKASYTPDIAAEKIIKSSLTGKTAIVFGPEDRGLKNEELILADLVINIRTSGFSSLNLSQAVMVMCYELYNKAVPTQAKPLQNSQATHKEKEGMYTHLKSVMDEIEFKMDKNPDYWVNRFRHFFSGRVIQSHEIRLIRGFLKQIIRYGQSKNK